MNWQGGARTHDLLINSQALPPAELHANTFYKTLHIEFVNNRGYQLIRDFNLPHLVFDCFLFNICSSDLYVIFAEQVSLLLKLILFFLCIYYNIIFLKNQLNFFNKNFFLTALLSHPWAVAQQMNTASMAYTLPLSSRFLV